MMLRNGLKVAAGNNIAADEQQKQNRKNAVKRLKNTFTPNLLPFYYFCNLGVKVAFSVANCGDNFSEAWNSQPGFSKVTAVDHFRVSAGLVGDFSCQKVVA
jgi:hypothetical protein